jgi:hypothetical protein
MSITEINKEDFKRISNLKTWYLDSLELKEFSLLKHNGLRSDDSKSQILTINIGTSKRLGRIAFDMKNNLLCSIPNDQVLLKLTKLSSSPITYGHYKDIIIKWENQGDIIDFVYGIQDESLYLLDVGNYCLWIANTGINPPPLELRNMKKVDFPPKLLNSNSRLAIKTRDYQPLIVVSSPDINGILIINPNAVKNKLERLEFKETKTIFPYKFDIDNKRNTVVINSEGDKDIIEYSLEDGNLINQWDSPFEPEDIAIFPTHDLVDRRILNHGSIDRMTYAEEHKQWYRFIAVVYLKEHLIYKITRPRIESREILCPFIGTGKSLLHVLNRQSVSDSLCSYSIMRPYLLSISKRGDIVFACENNDNVTLLSFPELEWQRNYSEDS